jgi:subtilisin family serine protease
VNPPIIGLIDHQTDPGNNDNHIDIALRPTLDEDSGLASTAPSGNIALAPQSVSPPVVPAPSGIWIVQVENVGTHEANLHAWIEQDDGGRPSGARRRQSRFVPADADPKFSVTGLATGQHTIAVGAYNTATHEVCRYSACGPTRPTTGHPRREKPDVCAPGEDDAGGRGVLSASSRKSRATRMNGTSAAAPHVAGLVALLFQYKAAGAPGALTADQIRTKVKNAASKGPLKPNRHNAADPTRPAGVKQGPVLYEMIGSGRIDVRKTL